MILTDIQDAMTIKKRLEVMFRASIRRQQGGLPVVFCKEYLNLIDDLNDNIRRMEDVMIHESRNI